MFSFPFLLVNNAFTQDLEYAKNTIKKLTSRHFYGRGYLKNGDYKAAKFIRNEFKKSGIKPIFTNYFQEYSFSVNTFPTKVSVSIDNKLLVAGTDYCMRANSPNINGTFDIVKLDTTLFKIIVPENLKNELANKIGIYDTVGWGNKWYTYFYRSKTPLPYKGTIQIIDKIPYFSVSSKQSNKIALIINQKAISKNAQKITLKIEAETLPHKAYNVIGTIPGEVDSFFVFTAHYDHLGGIGRNTFFAGANDNASGTAMVLDIAREFSKFKNHKYGLVFILFSGEEAGLLGSDYYTKNPVFPLEKIKMVFNLDMVGTGTDGVSVFNGSTHPKEFAILDSINKSLSLNLNLKLKGITANNDIYPFYKKKVAGVTLLTDDKNAPYHTTTDTFDKLTFVSYNGLVRLIKEYINMQ